MNILILGSFGSGALENYYLNGIQNLPITISTFDTTNSYYQAINRSIFNKITNKIHPNYFFTPVNTRLLRFIGSNKYDVILIFKGLTIFPDTLKELKYHTSLLCCYNPDHPFKFFSEGSGNRNILNSIQLYDLYFSYATRITKELKTRFQVNAHTIPFGYDDKPVDTKFDNQSALSQKLIFAGSYDRERAAFLSQLPADMLAIYGDIKWKTRNHLNNRLKNSYQGHPLNGDAYKQAIRDAPAVLNLLRKQNIEEGSHNMRTFEVPGYGGLLLGDRTEEQMLFFEDGKEALFYDCKEELASHISFISNNPASVRRMKGAAHQRAMRSGYSYTDRSRQLMNILSQYA